MANPNLTTFASPRPSTNLHSAIAAHMAAQARLDECEGDDNAFSSAMADADGVLWKLAETPCESDADLFSKLSYLLARERCDFGALISRYDILGKLSFAIELHLEQQVA
jgi:hypothetical protein